MREIRGVWLTNVDSDVLFVERKLWDALARLAETGFNTIYPVVWNKGQTTYPSAVASAVTGIVQFETLAKNDLFAVLVERAAELGLRVLPWFEYGLMAPESSALARNRPEWLLARLDGSRRSEHGLVRLNPAHPEVRSWLAALAVEVVGNYRVAGVQFDDHLGWPVAFGYDDLTVRRYQELCQTEVPGDPHAARWMAWRAKQLTGLVQGIRTALDRCRRGMILSLSPNPAGFAYSHSLQDWPEWQRLGLIDELVLQVYREDSFAFERELDKPEVSDLHTRIPVVIGILSGLRTRPVPIERVCRQVRCVRKRRLAGFSFFFYESLWNLTGESAMHRQAVLRQLLSAADY